MQQMPHHYAVTARAEPEGVVPLESAGLQPLDTAPPAEFGGPGDLWSPENLLVAAVADCYLLTFRAIARASRLEWHSLECQVTGTLDRVDKMASFTQFDIKAQLKAPPGTDEAKARRLLEKAEKGCLISNSLKAEMKLEIELALL
ncbi:MAG: OsmC family protein [Granulosicoccus sp.]